MRTKVFYNLPESHCYGCHACKEICPVQAISMVSDKEGFLFPRIDVNKCIECNACEKTCPTQADVSNSLFRQTPANVDASWEKNLNDRMASTSGGIFFVLGKHWLSQDGVVYGAGFDENLKVRHIRINTIEGLESLRGSKYVQSDINGTFRLVREDLKNGIKVLYSGTPCQIAGLRSFLKRDYDNLITVDLVCHGTPSPLLFRNHLKYIEKTKGKELKDYKFRGKLKSGWRAYIKYVYKDGDIECRSLGKDFFAHCFYNSLFNRRSCFTCDFSRSQRVGDITLSDFWNAEKSCRSLKIQRKYGFNMVMCNSDKGRALYDGIKDAIENVVLPSDVAIKGDVRLRHSENMPTRRERIFDEYYSHGYDWLVENRWPKPSIVSMIVPSMIKNLICEIKARI